MAETRVRPAAGDPYGPYLDQFREILPAPIKVGRSRYVEEGVMFGDGMQKLRLVHRVFGHGS
ncbi:hypothetical protein [Paraburkholderia azotifigens]|uniref:hypothetical protein n=1 Tax=Paraburkholderia azotifigens TaxID=2057004 RepID=UPI00048E11C7|nr:hypothetical protein [Paraburkholderia azotifigens]